MSLTDSTAKMPSKSRSSAPPNRVYKSSTPLVQKKLPVQKKRVRTYGKNAGPRVPITDNTLTQMDFVQMTPSFDEEEEIEDSDACDEEIEEPRKQRRRAMSDEPPVDEPKKRRKTMSDKPSTSKRSKKPGRKSMGDTPSATPQYHTQTITQIADWSFSAPEEGLEEDPEDAIYSGPYSSTPPKPSKRPTKAFKSTDAVSVSGIIIATYGDKPSPQTPRRNTPREILPSESPATPISTHSRTHASRVPLAEKSVNTPISFSTTQKRQFSPQKPPTLEIQDTFENLTDASQQSRMLSSPTKRISPAKTVRFAVLEEDKVKGIILPSAKRGYTRSSPFRKPLRLSTPIEIPDSDAESDEEEEEQAPPVGELLSDPQCSITKLQPETQYGEIGFETQFQMDRLLNRPQSPLELKDGQGDEMENNKTNGSNQTIERGSLTPTRVAKDPIGDITGDQTQLPESQLIGVDQGYEEPPGDRREYQTQLESQRLSTQYVNTMAPRTMNSDIFISISPEQVVDILNGTRDHITRNWKLPPLVSRVWMYETTPVSTLRYMASIGPAKLPGQIDNESGKGNVEFNARSHGHWYAYELLEMYELADPLPLAKLVKEEWLQAPPARFKLVRPAILGQLMANVKPPLLRLALEENEPAGQEGPSSSSTDTQEAEEQLLSTIQQYERRPELLEESVPSSQPPLDPTSPKTSQDNIQEAESSSPLNHPQPHSNVFHPSQATTVDLTQPPTPKQNLPTEIIWESPTRPVHSSRFQTQTQGSDIRDYGDPETLVPFSITSSQLLTKSQMLPESLLAESVPPPPGFILDSDAEEEEEEF